MLKPSELKKKSFSKTMRGYSIPEVDEYMEFLLEKYTELFRKNFELEQQLRAAVEQKGELEGEKESVRSALINAQKVASKIVETANERAEAIIDSAKVGCNTILSDFSEQINAERETVITLKEQVASLKRELFETYREHIERVEALTDLTDKVKVKTSEEYLNEAIAKTEEALKKMKAEKRPSVNVNIGTDTSEIDAVNTDSASGEDADKNVTVDPDALFESADTVVFDRVPSEAKDSDEDNSATVIIDKVKTDD